MPSPIPILTYHSLDESGSVISTAPDTFRRQMYSLCEWSYTGVSLADLIDADERNSQLPERPVVITFDDGYANVRQHGLPVLNEVGFNATLFAVAGYCGRDNAWPGQSKQVPRLPLLSWSGLRELQNGGIEIGAHTVTHPRLDELPPNDAQREIVDSQIAIEDRLGCEVAAFAYPYGIATPAVGSTVTNHFRYACTTQLKLARRTDDPYRLPRIDMYYFRNRLAFGLFPSVLNRFYLQIRRLGRGCRNRLLDAAVQTDQPLELHKTFPAPAPTPLHRERI